MRFVPIEDARGSAWREENKTIDDAVCEEITTLIQTKNLKRYQMRMDSLLVTADCLAQEGRISDQTYWNYCEVYRTVADGFRVMFPTEAGQ